LRFGRLHDSDRRTAHVEVDIAAATPLKTLSYVFVPGWDTEPVTETLPAIAVDETQLTEVVTKLMDGHPGSVITE
jgi:uncharacterized protein YndB with AHSA1/START domain